MLPRRLRLSRHAYPARAGARHGSLHFSLVAGVSREGGCAAVVSKKVARRSVDRHLLKRRMLAVMRPWCTSDRYVVVHARAGSTQLPYRELEHELSALLSSVLS